MPQLPKLIVLTLCFFTMGCPAVSVPPSAPPPSLDIDKCKVPTKLVVLNPNEIRVTSAKITEQVSLGEFHTKNTPELRELVSRGLFDAEVVEYLKCGAIARKEIDPTDAEQVHYFEDKLYFMSRGPTSEEVSRWRREHPAPTMHKKKFWEIISIPKLEEEEGEYKAFWKDIYWIGTDGWLCGETIGGGGSGDVGRGILVRTQNAGGKWSAVGKENFGSGEGKFTWGPHGTRNYSWSEIGPIYSMLYQKRNLGNRLFRVEGWLASSTGIYATMDGGEHWKRRTPPPNHADRYAFFSNLTTIENFHEIYAVGWQGITHWPALSGQWEVQMPTYTYAITSITVEGASEQRTIWAVGQGSPTPKGYGGKIYQRLWSLQEWRAVRLPDLGIGLESSFLDIVVKGATVIVIGTNGLIIRGVDDNRDNWVWSKVASGTESNLSSIIYGNDAFWIVGEDGIILKSLDNGQTWTRLPPVQDEKNKSVNLRRIRFFEGTGWVVGDKMVLKLVN